MGKEEQKKADGMAESVEIKRGRRGRRKKKKNDKKKCVEQRRKKTKNCLQHLSDLKEKKK